MRPDSLTTLFGTGLTWSRRTVDPAPLATSETRGSTASPVGVRSSGTRIRLAIISFPPFPTYKVLTGTRPPVQDEQLVVLAPRDTCATKVGLDSFDLTLRYTAQRKRFRRRRTCGDPTGCGRCAARRYVLVARRVRCCEGGGGSRSRSLLAPGARARRTTAGSRASPPAPPGATRRGALPTRRRGRAARGAVGSHRG